MKDIVYNEKTQKFYDKYCSKGTEFEIRPKEQVGGKYDKILCYSFEHGCDVKISPYNRYRTNKTSVTMIVDKNSYYIRKFNMKHNNQYDYSKMVYVDAKTHIIITCPIHGDFEQSPNGHGCGHGCSECGSIKNSNKKRISSSEYFKRVNIIHNNKYDYSLSKYKGSSQMIDIICPVHGKFEQRAGGHLVYGCDECSKENRDRFHKWAKENPNKIAYFYIVKLEYNGESFYKAGVTRHENKKRFGEYRFTDKDISGKYKVVEEVIWIKDNAKNISKLELNTIRNYRSSYTPKYKFGGYTEIIDYDQDYINKLKNY